MDLQLSSTALKVAEAMAAGKRVYVEQALNYLVEKGGSDLHLKVGTDTVGTDTTGSGALADYVHAKGLKFGIHIMRGIPRQAVERNLPIKGTKYRAAGVADRENFCRWNPDMWGVDTTKPGSQEYYDSIVELYASWGVDFIKADDMGSHLYQPAEMKALS